MDWVNWIHFEHIPGLAEAAVNLTAIGYIVSYFWGRFAVDVNNNWPVRGPDGYIPGVIERGFYNGVEIYDRQFGAIVAFPHAIWTFIKWYGVGSAAFITLVFFSELFFGWHPPDFPTLYYIGVFAIFRSIYVSYDVMEQAGNSKWATGHRSF